MKTQKQVIYLDNNATTPVDKRVLEAMMPFLTENYANANSTHLFGVDAYEAVKAARLQVANLIGAEPNEIVFTSGATESINLAIKGIAESNLNKGKHIITISTEHNAVLDTCRYLETKGYEITYLPVKPDGIIDLNEIRNAIRDDTILVTVMYANNETGVLQPVREIADITHKAGSLFMTDATQAIGKIALNVDALGIDLLSLSGHKIYAPKGVGALYVRQRAKRVKVSALVHGGGHEKGLRSGTLNVPGIVALGSACALVQKELKESNDKISVLRNYLETELLKIEGTSINGNIENRLPNTSNILFKGTDSDAIIMGLSNLGHDLPVIAVSKGSACNSISIEPSHVLTAMGLDELSAFSSIRFSLGKYNTKKEIDFVVEAVTKVVSGLRAMVN